MVENNRDRHFRVFHRLYTSSAIMAGERDNIADSQRVLGKTSNPDSPRYYRKSNIAQHSNTDLVSSILVLVFKNTKKKIKVTRLFFPKRTTATILFSPPKGLRYTSIGPKESMVLKN